VNAKATTGVANPGSRADIRTPVSILTGFLGSGKTTLLNKALRAPSMAKTALVINEFGAVSIDHSLIVSSNDAIMVLENGCLCCTVFGDLVQTFNRLYHSREAGDIAFEHVIIETSGLADLAPVIQAFYSEPTLAGLYRVGRVVVCIDAVNAMHTLTEHVVSVGQVALADSLLITKLDLVPSEARSAALAALTVRLRRLNRTAAIDPIDAPGINCVQLLLDAGLDPTTSAEAAGEWLKATFIEHPMGADLGTDPLRGNPRHLHDPTIASFNFIRESPIPREALQLLLTSIERHLGPGLLRVKGLVNVLEEPGRPAVIQGAQHLLHNLTWLEEWPDGDHRTRVVFITQGIEVAELSEMMELLERVASRTAKARLRASSPDGMNIGLTSR
jgi:G3E family GTPase